MERTMNDTVYTLHRGSTPLLLSLPHAGTHIPPDIAAKLQPRALQVEDTDWFLDRLYAFATALGASLIVPRHSRYVVDLNRPSDNRRCTPAPTTPSCARRASSPASRCTATAWRPTRPRSRSAWAGTGSPTTTRCATSWPRLKGRAWPRHAVRRAQHQVSELPWLFEGKLPDLNLGTASGSSCAPSLRDALASLLQRRAATVHCAVDGRFKGGHITRHYGQPARGRACGAAGDVLEHLHGETAPYTLDPAAHRACSRCCSRRCCARCSTGGRSLNGHLFWAPRAWIDGRWAESVLAACGRR
jgi:N-formylglutamate deformylase